MFGELLDAEAIDRAFQLARETKLLLVVGSTLEVQPVAGLPWETVTAGGDVAIVNLGPTAFDRRATLKIDGEGRRGAPARSSSSSAARRRALERSLVEHPRARRADLPLDLVRDARALPQRVGDDGLCADDAGGPFISHLTVVTSAADTS